MSVGDNVGAITAFAVGFQWFGSATVELSAITTLDGWSGVLGNSASAWNQSASDFGITWDDFLNYDIDSKNDIDSFVLFTTNDINNAINAGTNTTSGQFQIYAEDVDPFGFSPSVILNQSGTFGGAVGVNNSAVSSVPEPTSLVLLVLGLTCFGFSRKKIMRLKGK